MNPLPLLGWTVGDIATLTGMVPSELCWLAGLAESLYQRRRVLKTSGEWRNVDEPDEPLKTVQSLIGEQLSGFLDSPIAYGTRGRDHIDAARVHERQRFVGIADIKKFFQSVTSERIHNLLVHLGCSEELAAFLVRLLTFQGSLPPGAPSSPAIANLLLAASDDSLAIAAKTLGVRITRYVDDFTCSSSDESAVRHLLRLIAIEVERLGIRLDGKTQFMPRSRPQIVLGICVNNGVSIPPKYRKRVESEVRKILGYGATKEQLKSVRAKIEYIGRLHPDQAERLTKSLHHARPDRRPIRFRLSALAEGYVRATFNVVKAESATQYSNVAFGYLCASFNTPGPVPTKLGGVEGSHRMELWLHKDQYDLCTTALDHARNALSTSSASEALLAICWQFLFWERQNRRGRPRLRSASRLGGTQ